MNYAPSIRPLLFCSILVGSLFIYSASGRSATTTQRTEGDCSPAISNVTGDVTIIGDCGVPRLALERLLELLKIKDRELKHSKERIEILSATVTEWISKYKELEARTKRDPNELAKKANALLTQGKLEEAGVLYDKALEDQAGEVKKIAANHYKRGEIHGLLFENSKALQHFETAHRLDPKDFQYASSFANSLVQERDLKRAEAVYKQILDEALISGDSVLNQARLSMILNNLGIVFVGMDRLPEAEDMFNRSLDIRRRLTKEHADGFLGPLGETLTNLGVHYVRTQRLEKAAEAYTEAVNIFRQLAKQNPLTYEPVLAIVLNNVGNTYSKNGKLVEAAVVYNQTLAIYRRLAKASPLAYEPCVANTLNNFGKLFMLSGRWIQADKAFSEALEIYERRRLTNPAAFDPDVPEIPKKQQDVREKISRRN